HRCPCATGAKFQRISTCNAHERERESRYSRSTGELSTRVRRSLGRRQVHHVTTRYRTTSDFNAFVMQIYYAFRRDSHFTRQMDGGGFEPPVNIRNFAMQVSPRDKTICVFICSLRHCYYIVTKSDGIDPKASKVAILVCLHHAT